MKINVLQSGSKGNSTLLKTDESLILIDAGITYKKLKESVEEKGYRMDEIDGVLITHIHTDHIKGLASIIKKTNKKVYIPKKLYKDINKLVDKENISIIEDTFTIKDLTIELIYTSHDVECSVGYIITSNEKTLVYVTDTGYINEKYFSKMTNKNVYILESNYDETMLRKGPYPFTLQQRIRGDEGHLSNDVTAKILEKLIGDQTTTIVLAHISENNNTYDLAYETTTKRLGKKLDNKKIYVAHQEEELELIEVK